MLDVFSVCVVVVVVVQSVFSTSSSAVVPRVASSPPHRSRHNPPSPHPRWDHLVFYGLYYLIKP